MIKRTLLPLAALGLLWRWRKQAQQQEPLDLANKVVIITGASSGIGAATAHAFAAEGARVVLAARREDALRTVQAELGIYGTPAQHAQSLVVPTDVTQDADLHQLVQTTLDTFGRIDVLVNNAGLAFGGKVHQITPAQLRRLTRVNITGPIRLTQIILPVMLRQEPVNGVRGHIVNVASVAGTISAPGQAAYCATRRGLIRFSTALRREVAGTGVHVSAVCPTWTATPMIEGFSEAQLRANGGLFPGEHLHLSAVPARAIVDAVQVNRPFVNLGGWMMRFGGWSEALVPALMDLHWRINVDAAAYMALMKSFND